MAANDVKTAFRLPGGANEGFIRNLIWQHHHQQQHQKLSSNSHQVFSNIHRKRYVLKSLVFSLQLYQKRDSNTGVFL